MPKKTSKKETGWYGNPAALSPERIFVPARKPETFTLGFGRIPNPAKPISPVGARLYIGRKTSKAVKIRGSTFKVGDTIHFDTFLGEIMAERTSLLTQYYSADEAISRTGGTFITTQGYWQGTQEPSFQVVIFKDDVEKKTDFKTNMITLGEYVCRAFGQESVFLELFDKKGNWGMYEVTA